MAGWPERADFDSSEPHSGWWYIKVSDSSTDPMAYAQVCETVGRAVVINLQRLLRASLHGPNAGPVTGDMDAGTLRDLRRYASLLNIASEIGIGPEIDRAVIHAEAGPWALTPSLMRFVIWVTYYHVRPVLLHPETDDSTRTIKPALLEDLPLDQIRFSVLDLSDEEVSCIRDNITARPGDEYCQEVFEEVGATDAKFPRVQTLAYITSPTPAALALADKTGLPLCTPVATLAKGFTLADPRVGQASDETVYMRWHNWILQRRAAGITTTAKAGGGKFGTSDGGAYQTLSRPQTILTGRPSVMDAIPTPVKAAGAVLVLYWIFA